MKPIALTVGMGIGPEISHQGIGVFSASDDCY